MMFRVIFHDILVHTTTLLVSNIYPCILTQHFDGDGTKPLMKIFTRFMLYTRPDLNFTTNRIIPYKEPVHSLVTESLFIKSTQGHKEIYMLLANFTRQLVPDFNTYLALKTGNHSSKMINNVPYELMQLFPIGTPIAKMKGGAMQDLFS